MILCAIAFVISLVLVPWYAYQTARRSRVSPVGGLAAWSGLLLMNGTLLAHLAGVL